jgi:hypothetical protein
MNLFALSNVELHPDVSKKLGQESIGQPPIDMCRLVMNLAMANPLWRFIVTDTMGDHRPVGFSVVDSGEEIGKIGRQYYRNDYKLALTNDRISDKRERTASYRTSDVDKAILMAKKMFGKMNPNERINKAKDAAERIVTRASWNKERERTQHQSLIKNEMLAWVETKGHDMFMKFIKIEAIPSLKHKVTTSMEKVELLDTEMKTIEKVQKDFSDNKTALVVKDSGKYLVKIGDKVDLYDDNTLPVDMRMKMGMLKLVEDEQYLTDVGCKVSSEIFVLLVDELTNVSQGV